MIQADIVWRHPKDYFSAGADYTTSNDCDQYVIVIISEIIHSILVTFVVLSDGKMK